MAWRFEPGAPLRPEFIRVATEEIAKIRKGLSDEEGDYEKAVHEARQGFKRLRALLRLARPSLGVDFAPENKRWRDSGRLLSGSRDETVRLKCFNMMVSECRGTLPADGLDLVRASLTCCNARGGNGRRNGDQAAEVLRLVDGGREKIDRMPWPKNAKALFSGLRKGQKMLRNGWKRAKADPAAEALHDWRKRVKDQAAHLRLFRRVLPDELKTRWETEKATAELLGDEHDLWLLREHLRALAVVAEAADTRDLLLARIEEKRSALRQQVLANGEGFATQKSKAFAAAVCAAWDASQPEKPAKRAKEKEAAPA